MDPKVSTFIKIFAGKIFDSYTTQLFENHLITVSTDSGLIVDVKPFGEEDYELLTNSYVNIKVVDLRGLTVLPGFVDAHVHFFLHPYSEASWEDQLTKESVIERTLRASVHARRTLMAGFTAVRDLGTEGAGDADIALRKCLSGPKPILPGPRYFCANRAIVCTGSYGPKSSVHLNKEGIEDITGAEVADGKDECIKAVRRQIGAGADWIKIYADYRFRSRLIGVSADAGRQSMATFSTDELKVLIDTAHSYGVKVAAHTTNNETMEALIKLKIDTLEHGYGMKLDGALYMLDDHPQVKWVPTLSAFYTLGDDEGRSWENTQRTFKMAIEHLENIACGGDTGVFAHGENALEMKLMSRLGADWKVVLKWATLGGWECIRSMRWEGSEGEARINRLDELREDARVVGDNEVPFGAIRIGFAADIIATSGDLVGNFEDAVSAKSIEFVMKGGQIFKLQGLEQL